MTELAASIQNAFIARFFFFFCVKLLAGIFYPRQLGRGKNGYVTSGLSVEVDKNTRKTLTPQRTVNARNYSGLKSGPMDFGSTAGAREAWGALLTLALIHCSK
ncbi:hypothetical protein BHE90_016436 [Fusarium euwallaceae]|uniref:Uncharacterized protein n=1 Tax=Fusarium euwallaceae TaxID=1147111 RepID=A0A430L0F8_9HYPO|nr:hypothetical protein BHE90_016436 [Fusarium euwallaceae]